MPMVWAPPDRLLFHKGVNIYYIYKNDSFDSTRREYIYSTSPLGLDDDTDDESGVFDIRDLANYREFKDVQEDPHKKCIIDAIDRGYLTRHEQDDGPVTERENTLPESVTKYTVFFARETKEGKEGQRELQQIAVFPLVDNVEQTEDFVAFIEKHLSAEQINDLVVVELQVTPVNWVKN